MGSQRPPMYGTCRRKFSSINILHLVSAILLQDPTTRAMLCLTFRAGICTVSDFDPIMTFLLKQQIEFVLATEHNLVVPAKV